MKSCSYTNAAGRTNTLLININIGWSGVKTRKDEVGDVRGMLVNTCMSLTVYYSCSIQSAPKLRSETLRAEMNQCR